MRVGFLPYIYSILLLKADEPSLRVDDGLNFSMPSLWHDGMQHGSNFSRCISGKLAHATY